MSLPRVIAASLMGVVLVVTGAAVSQAQVNVVATAGSGFIPDGSGNTTTGPPLDMALDVPGGYGAVQTVVVDLVLSHPAVGELSAILIAPDGTSHPLFAYTGWNGVDGAFVSMGSTTRLSARYLFSDGAFTNWWTTANGNTVMPPAVYRTSVPGGTPSPFRGSDTLMNPVFAGKPSAGRWTLRLTDSRFGNTGILTSVLLNLETATTVLQPPTLLQAAAIVGNEVTLRWTPPTFGPIPTDYVVEGGVAPGGVLGSLPVGAARPVLSFMAPSGSFYLRVHSIANGVRSPASNEIRVHVNTPVAPSAPVSLLGVVDGTNVELSWRDTFAGGAATAHIFDVTGAATLSVPIGPEQTFAYAGVPGGTYTFRVRSVNTAGTSGTSNAVALTFPRACAGATPGAPTDFLATAVGSSLRLLWNPPSAGPAATRYKLYVTGAVTTDVLLTGRSLSVPVPPGSYLFRLESGNACGFGGLTPGQTVVVP